MEAESTLVALVYFFLAACSDLFSVWWHRAREQGKAVRAALIGFWRGVVGWVPLVLLITEGNWLIIVADLVGGACGSYWGVSKYAKRA